MQIHTNSNTNDNDIVIEDDEQKDVRGDGEPHDPGNDHDNEHDSDNDASSDVDIQELFDEKYSVYNSTTRNDTHNTC